MVKHSNYHHFFSRIFQQKPKFGNHAYIFRTVFLFINQKNAIFSNKIRKILVNIKISAEKSIIKMDKFSQIHPIFKKLVKIEKMNATSSNVEENRRKMNNIFLRKKFTKEKSKEIKKCY
jgi:hypothetical protein